MNVKEDVAVQSGEMYIRFVVGHDGEDHRSLTGLIAEARLLRDRDDLDQYQIAWLEDTYDWFNEYLPCPPFSSSTWPRDAVSWFKDDAGESIRRMWELAALLQQHGIPVRMLRSANPGKILYEDAFQIVVEEWRVL
jgi:hypothetical protein